MSPDGATEVVLDGLVKRYRGAPAPVVDDVDLVVPPGGLVSLLGPSGCGKTTTLKVVAGLLAADAGDVRFDGASVLGLPAERRPVAMVFQKPLLFPHLSVGANVAFGLRVRRTPRAEARRRVAEMLDLVRLPGFVDRSVGELSGGQEQRVALARALVVRPRVLLLDEPLSQLDAGLRVEMRELVRTVQREVGVTTLFVTHDQEEAVALSDRVALLLDGRVAQEGVPRDFYERPATLGVARFFGARNLLPGTARDGVVETSAGTVAVGSGTRTGPAVLVVRPEAVQVLPAGASGDGCVAATVEETRYLGTAVRVVARVGRTPVSALVPPSTDVRAGQPVTLRLPREACHAVPADGPADDVAADPEPAPAGGPP